MDKTISRLEELLVRLEEDGNRKIGMPKNIFDRIAREIAKPDFLLNDQSAWDRVRNKLELFAAGDNYQLGMGAVKILGAVACREAPLLASNGNSFTPQAQAARALGTAFRSPHQMVQIGAADTLGEYGVSGRCFAALHAVDALRKGFGAEDHFVEDSLLISFARAVTGFDEMRDLRKQIAGLEAGLQNPRTTQDVGSFLLKIARRGPQQAALVINLIDRAFLTPELDSEVYDEGVEMLAKIGPRNKASAGRAIAALDDLTPTWQASRDGRAGAVSALPKIARAQPSVAAQAIDTLFGSLRSNFEDNDAWIQMEAANAVIALAVSFPEHASDIRKRLKIMADGAYGDTTEMTSRALNGIEPALHAAQERRALAKIAKNVSQPTLQV